MTRSVHKRDYDIFLSHAHKDHEFVELLDNWLTEKVGLNVWYDARELSGGASLATDLQKGISRCRGLLLIASDEAMQKGWVKAEYNAAMDQKANHQDFRVVALRLENANVDDLMQGLTWIDVPAKTIDFNTAVAIIKAFYPGEKRPNPRNSRDVYVSCSWRSNEDVSALTVKRKLIQTGFRLIGDSEDQDAFGTGNRVERIIASCGALVCILPYRNEEFANSTDKPYKYFIQEIDCAKNLGIPTIVIADPRIRRAEQQDADWLRMNDNQKECSEEINKRIEGLWDDWISPPQPQYIFCAMDLDSESVKSTGHYRSLIERVTGMPTSVGTEITKEPIHKSIVEHINGSFLLIADITDDNLNTCIEAGMGISAGTNVAIFALGPSRRPPFMLRSLQMPTYKDDIEKIGLIHKIVWPYRRRVINAEM